MIYKKLLIVLLAGCTIGHPLAAQSPATDTIYRFTLAEAQQYAIENSPAVRNATLDLSIAQKKIWETTAIGLPQATVSGNYQYTPNVPEVSFGSFLNPDSLPDGQDLQRSDIYRAYQQADPVKLGVEHNMVYDITVTQLIFSGEYLVGLQASKIYREFAERALTQTEAQTRESVAKSYYLALIADENLAILRESLDVTSKLLADMTAMHQEGFVESTDVDQLKINQTTLANTIKSIEGQRDVAYRLLKFQMGLEINSPMILTDSLSIFTSESALLWAPADFDQSSNIDFKLLETQEQLMKLNLKREQSKFLPTVSGFYKHQEQMNESDFNFFMPDMFGVTISLPIFTSGQRLSVVSQRKMELEKARISKDQAGQGLWLDYYTTVNDYQTALNNYFTLKQTRQLTKTIYDRTIVKYNEGVASSLDLTQAQGQYLQSQTDYFTAMLTYLQNRAKLERLLTAN